MSKLVKSPKFKIVSGGQTGADRAGLDAAIACKIPHGGWCPKGRIAEDGVIGKRYRLKQSPHSDYVERTLWNVRDSDATLILTTKKKLSGGTLMTWRFAKKLKKPVCHISATTTKNPALSIQKFVEKNKIRVLNIAGPRASKEAGVYDYTFEVLCEYLHSLKAFQPVMLNH